jgi:hypothetical protein
MSNLSLLKQRHCPTGTLLPSVLQSDVVCQRRQEKHTCAYFLSAFLRANPPPGGLTNESEVSSRGNRRISAYVRVVVLGVLKAYCLLGPLNTALS